MALTALKPMRPAEHAERQLLEAILSGGFAAGAALPSERDLAEQLGVTRPTVREALQRLSREGWVTIRHGKPTRVNDYLKEGGLGILGSIARYGDHFAGQMVEHLLRVRAALMPDVAGMAAARDARCLLEFLETSEALDDNATAYAQYDWNLQMLMVELSGNPIFRLIMNDFARMYRLLGRSYFQHATARDYSRAYYRQLKACLADDQASVGTLVRETMVAVIDIWKQCQ